MALGSMDFDGSYMVTWEHSLSLKTPLRLFWCLRTCGGISGMLPSHSGIQGDIRETVEAILGSVRDPRIWGGPHADCGNARWLWEILGVLWGPLHDSGMVGVL